MAPLPLPCSPSIGYNPGNNSSSSNTVIPRTDGDPGSPTAQSPVPSDPTSQTTIAIGATIGSLIFIGLVIAIWLLYRFLHRAKEARAKQQRRDERRTTREQEKTARLRRELADQRGRINGYGISLSSPGSSSDDDKMFHSSGSSGSGGRGRSRSCPPSPPPSYNNPGKSGWKKSPSYRTAEIDYSYERCGIHYRTNLPVLPQPEAKLTLPRQTPGSDNDHPSNPSNNNNRGPPPPPPPPSLATQPDVTSPRPSRSTSISTLSAHADFTTGLGGRDFFPTRRPSGDSLRTIISPRTPTEEFIVDVSRAPVIGRDGRGCGTTRRDSIRGNGRLPPPPSRYTAVVSTKPALTRPPPSDEFFTSTSSKSNPGPGGGGGGCAITTGPRSTTTMSAPEGHFTGIPPSLGGPRPSTRTPWSKVKTLDNTNDSPFPPYPFGCGTAVIPSSRFPPPPPEEENGHCVVKPPRPSMGPGGGSGAAAVAETPARGKGKKEDEGSVRYKACGYRGGPITPVYDADGVLEEVYVQDWDGKA